MGEGTGIGWIGRSGLTSSSEPSGTFSLRRCVAASLPRTPRCPSRHRDRRARSRLGVTSGWDHRPSCQKRSLASKQPLGRTGRVLRGASTRVDEDEAPHLSPTPLERRPDAPMAALLAVSLLGDGDRCHQVARERPSVVGRLLCRPFESSPDPLMGSLWQPSAERLGRVRHRDHALVAGSMTNLARRSCQRIWQMCQGVRRSKSASERSNPVLFSK